jgi:segregation and condensation protein B
LNESNEEINETLEDDNEEIDEISEDDNEEVINETSEDDNEEIIDDSEQEIDQIEESVKSDVSEVSEEELLAHQLRDFHRNQIEASLYVAGRPLTIEDLSTKLEISKKEVEELINEVAFDYLERSTALVINRVGESYQMALKPEYVEKVVKFAKGGAIAERYLRTLTIVALKQPILKSLVVKIRGSGAYEHVKYLLEQGLVIADKKGRSHELSTTDKYAEMFGLPKDKIQMKRVMISQLGLDEVSSDAEEIPEDEMIQGAEESVEDEIASEAEELDEEEISPEDEEFVEDETSSENEENTEE